MNSQLIDILNRFNVIVCQHENVGKLFGRCAKERNGVELDGLRKVYVALPRANGKVGNAVVEHTKACIGVNEVQISPIDADVVARSVERLLLVVPHPNVTFLMEAINFFYNG